MLLKTIFWFWWRKKKSDSEFLSYNLMLNSGKKFRTLRDKKNKYSNSRVVRKKISERNKKKHNSPLQVKWSVPKFYLDFCSSYKLQSFPFNSCDKFLFWRFPTDLL